MVNRSNLLIDNSIKYTYQEVKALENVKNYLLGNEYDKDFITDDINLVGNCYKINPGHKLLVDFDNYFLNFLDKKYIETLNFSNVLLCPKDNYFYQELLEYESLPLRTSENPLIDKKILEEVLSLGNISYDRLLGVLVNSNPKKEEIIDKIYNFVVKNGITYESFGNSSKIGWFSKYPKTDDEIKDNFKIAKNNYLVDTENKKIYNCHISKYTELYAYEYLKKGLKPYEKIKWVSRYVGDGYGYDLVVINDLTGEVKLYEVKGSILKEREKEASLTSYETNTLILSTSKDMHYHVIKVFIDDNERKIYDINVSKNDICVTDEENNEYLINKKDDKDEDGKLIYKYRFY